MDFQSQLLDSAAKRGWRNAQNSRGSSRPRDSTAGMAQHISDVLPLVFRKRQQSPRAVFGRGGRGLRRFFVDRYGGFDADRGRNDLQNRAVGGEDRALYQ